MLWSLSYFIIFSIQWMEMQAVIKSLGDLVISLGGYLAIRFLTPDRDTVLRMIKVMAVICVNSRSLHASRTVQRTKCLPVFSERFRPR